MKGNVREEFTRNDAGCKAYARNHNVMRRDSAKATSGLDNVRRRSSARATSNQDKVMRRTSARAASDLDNVMRRESAKTISYRNESMRSKPTQHRKQNLIGTNVASNMRRNSIEASGASMMKRKTKAALVKFSLAVLVVAAIVCVILVSNHSVINADENGTPVKLEKYYKTITVQQGDSLWSIAKEYKSGDYRTVQDYVDELKSMNNLGSDQITAGNKLVVAYFEES